MLLPHELATTPHTIKITILGTRQRHHVHHIWQLEVRMVILESQDQEVRACKLIWALGYVKIKIT